MKNLIFLFSIVLTSLILLGGCGNSDTGAGILNDDQNQDTDEEGSLDGATIDGLYMAKFMTLNPHVNGTIPGSLTLFRKEDRLLTFVRLFAGGPRTWHQQGIYLGRRCPDLSDDTNADGYIDITEAMSVVGKMIIPLDANMNSQMSGRNFFPISDLSGYYHYERVSSFRRLFDDLRTVDLDTEDHITKLGPDEKFSFLGRVILVQGVMQETILPETVAGIGKRKPFQTLPITCGIIAKVEGSPAEPDSGEIPGPVAEVIEGQDQPAPAGEGETEGETGGETGGGTNENEEGEVGDDTGSGSGSTTGGGTTTGGTTTGGTTTGATTTGGTTTGGTTTGGTTTGGTTTGGTTTGGTTTGGTTTGGTTTGGFVGGFIGGFVGGDDNGI